MDNLDRVLLKWKLAAVRAPLPTQKLVESSELWTLFYFHSHSIVLVDKEGSSGGRDHSTANLNICHTKQAERGGGRELPTAPPITIHKASLTTTTDGLICQERADITIWWCDYHFTMRWYSKISPFSPQHSFIHSLQGGRSRLATQCSLSGRSPSDECNNQLSMVIRELIEFLTSLKRLECPVKVPHNTITKLNQHHHRVRELHWKSSDLTTAQENAPTNSTKTQIHFC